MGLHTAPGRMRRGSASPGPSRPGPLRARGAPPAATARAGHGAADPGRRGFQRQMGERKDWMFMEYIGRQDLLLGWKNLGPSGFFS